jgi:hypothetical protein
MQTYLNKMNGEYVINSDHPWFEYRKGNILETTDIDYLVHQANCFHCMGGGVAFAISRRWPIVAEVDKKTLYGDKSKLGTFSIATVSTQLRIEDEVINKSIKVVNLYSQFDPGPFITSYEEGERLNAIKTGLINLREYIINELIASDIKNKQVYIGVPWLIGCGISGLKFDNVFEIFKEVFEEYSDTMKIVFVDFNK